MIVLGSVLAIIGFLGCCGAVKQVKIFLIIVSDIQAIELLRMMMPFIQYAVIIIIIILIEVGIAIYFVAFRSKFESEIIPKLRVTVQDNYEGPLGLKSELNRTRPRALSLAWDFLMYNVSTTCPGQRNLSSWASLFIAVSMLWREGQIRFQRYPYMGSK